MANSSVADSALNGTTKPSIRHASGKGKGQMFMIAAIFIIIGFVLLKSMLSLPALTQEKTFQDTSYLDRSLKNVRNEYDYMASISSMHAVPNRTGPELVRNFSDYMRDEFDSRILYVFVFSNGTTRNFSVAVGNFLQNNISGTVNVTGSDPAGAAFNLNDTTNATFGFNATATWINVTLNYTLQGREAVENFRFNASSRNYISAFFDISLRESGFFARSKSVYNRTWFDTT